jgi:hypothetical protein
MGGNNLVKINEVKMSGKANNNNIGNRAKRVNLFQVLFKNSIKTTDGNIFSKRFLSLQGVIS